MELGDGNHNGLLFNAGPLQAMPLLDAQPHSLITAAFAPGELLVQFAPNASNSKRNATRAALGATLT